MNLLFFLNKELQTSATGASIEELEYASNLFEWILNSSMSLLFLCSYVLKIRSKHPTFCSCPNKRVVAKHQRCKH